MSRQVEINKRNIEAQQRHIVSKDATSKCRVLKGAPIKKASLGIGRREARAKKQVGDNDSEGDNKCYGTNAPFETDFSK